jgi:hypothetical protein
MISKQNPKFYAIWNEFEQYCEINNIPNCDEYFITVFTDAFNVLKYGKTPPKIKRDQPIEVSRPTYQEIQGKGDGEDTQKNTKPVTTKAVEIINNSDIYDD